MSVSTLANWRCSEKGPRYSKNGKWVEYDLVDLEAWREAKKIDPEAAKVKVVKVMKPKIAQRLRETLNLPPVKGGRRKVA
ncbi:MAG: hypothetical protein HQL97_01075 [Magnetococcales bacterium]|nr:hypothetical protein [Magnetococcales bacterium]